MSALSIKRSLTLIILCGLIVSGSVFFFLKNWEVQLRNDEFRYKASDHAAAIQSEIEHLIKDVANVRNLIESDINTEGNSPLDPNIFMRDAKKIVLDNPALSSISWAIIEKSDTPSKLRTDTHLKIIYITRGNQARDDNDNLHLYSYYDEHTSSKIGLDKAILAVVGHYEANESSKELGLVGIVHDTGNNTPVGAVIVEWEMNKLVEHALSKIPVSAQDILISFVHDDGREESLYTHVSRSRTAADMGVYTGLNETIKFKYNGYTWLFKFEAAPQFIRNHPAYLAWPSAAFFLLLTFFLAWYVRNTGKQHLIIENEIIMRTKELKTSFNKINKLATAVEHANEIIIITDEKGITEYVNTAFEKISGYSADEMIGKKANLVKSNKHPNEFYTAMWKTLNAGKSWDADFINRKKDGELYKVTQSITPILGKQGDIVGFVSVQRDVTRQRQIERKIQHTDRVESLGVLAGGIAHDFNNLLTAILGNASLVIRKLDATSPMLKHMNAIESASLSAADLCKQMLAYSGKGQFVVSATSLSELLENIGKLIDVSLSKNVSIQYHLNSQLPCIDADVAQMQQIVLNLVTNASEAMSEKGGVILMTTGTMDTDLNYLNACVCHGDVLGRYVYLEISDTGHGMDKATQKKIFDPFFTTKFTGRGLGMSALLGIVKGHKGALHIYSKPGKGTTIRVAFPVSDEVLMSSKQSLSPTTPSPTIVATETVLIIDDEETICEVAKVLLEEFGFEVLVANDGVEGVEMFQQHQGSISLVLLDMTMPRMDGITCFTELKKIDPNVRVLLSSGYSEQDATKHFVGKGLAGFIQKPYSVDEFADKIQQALKVEVKIDKTIFR